MLKRFIVLLQVLTFFVMFAYVAFWAFGGTLIAEAFGDGLEWWVHALCLAPFIPGIMYAKEITNFAMAWMIDGKNIND